MMGKQTATERALAEIANERRRQDAKWGTQRHGMTVWLTVLQEEVGEAAQDILALRSTVNPAERRGMVDNIAYEVTQLAAVAVALLEHLNEAIDAGDGLPSETWE